MANYPIRSFTGGELAPSLFARTDQSKFATGLRKCRNFFIHRHGGISNRSGTEHIAVLRQEPVKHRLIKFVFNADQTYIIELGVGYARFIRQGVRITAGTPDAWVTATDYKLADTVYDGVYVYYSLVAHTSDMFSEPGVGVDWTNVWYRMSDVSGPAYEIPTPYDEADLPDIRLVQSADVIVLTHPGHAPRELRRYAHDRWTLVLAAFGPSISPPTGLSLGGGGAGARVYWAITAVSATTGEESLPAYIDDVDSVPGPGLAGTIIGWEDVPGADAYRVYRSEDGKTYGLVSGATGNPAEVADTSWDDATETAGTTDVQLWTSALGQARNVLGSITATNKAYNDRYTIRGKATLQGGFGVIGQSAGRCAIYYSRDGEFRQFAGHHAFPYFVFGEMSTTHDIEMHVDIPDNGYTSLTIDVVPEVYSMEGGGSSSFSVDFTTAPQDEVVWTILNAGLFIDHGLPPDILQQPPTDPKVFLSPDKYPTAVTYYQQRLMLANTNTEPEKAWGSQTANYRNFGTSIPIQDDDAVSFSMAGRQVNAIMHMLDLGRLIMMTSGSEISVEGDESGILKPDAINPRQVSYSGSGRLAPIPIVDTAIYLQARQGIVRDLKPISSDKYTGTDLTVFSAHLFEGHTIVDWDYAQIPHSIIWAVRDDGILLGLTYLREHDIWGWHVHHTAGLVENVCVVPEGNEDAVYLIVNRPTGRHLERMASRFFVDIDDAVFMDDSLAYNGWNTGTDSLQVTGGPTWAFDELLTIHRTGGTFSASNVGDAIVFLDGDTEYRINITAYLNPTHVQGFPSATLPLSLRGTHTTVWALAVDEVSGLDHLEGLDLAVFADGFVVTSPHNPYMPTVTVIDGTITFDRPYIRIRAGLPYVSDMETLDIDTPSGPSRKDRGTLINRVGLVVDKSRGIWAGRQEPTGDDPTELLTEIKPRSTEEPLSPANLISDYVEVNIDANWDSNGRIFVRQVDPLPLSILAAIPQGHIG